MTADEITAEIQKFVKALLGYGARFPKELMLFVKNLVFLDGAIATLAPDLDLFAEIATISMYFAEHHGERIAAEIGLDEESFEFDFTGIKASFGVDLETTDTLTYEDLLERRAIIRDRMQERREQSETTALPTPRIQLASRGASRPLWLFARGLIAMRAGPLPHPPETPRTLR